MEKLVKISMHTVRSNSQHLNSFLRRVMAKKLYTGHLFLCSQFFEKGSVLYVHSSMLNVPVYPPYYGTRFAKIMDLPGKKAMDEAIACIKKSGPSYQERDGRYAVYLSVCLYYFLE